jgi:micrococcal nuclease
MNVCIFPVKRGKIHDMKKDLMAISFFLGTLAGMFFYNGSIPSQETKNDILPLSAKTSTGVFISPNKFYDVVRTVDGDTLVVQLNGVAEKVRLIGLDTPEIVDPRKTVECFGKEASEEAKKILTGQRVRLETDPSQEERDKYGRLLAYVFLENGANFNRLMIENGYGHEYTYDLPYKYQTEFKLAEKEARKNERGLWAKEACGKNF